MKMSEKTIMKCKICGSEENVAGFNIKFKRVWVCESCACIIADQQVHEMVVSRLKGLKYEK